MPTFFLNQWIRRLPPQIMADHLHLESDEVKKVPDQNSVVIGS